MEPPVSHRLKEAYNAFASIAESAEGELSALRAQLEQKGAELAGLRAAVVCERSKAAADTTRLEEELSFLNQQLGERDAAISSLREQARRLNADYDNAKAAAAVNVAALSAEIMSLKSENTALRADVVSASAGVASAVERERAKSQEAQQAHMLVIAGIIKENEALKQSQQHMSAAFQEEINTLQTNLWKFATGSSKAVTSLSLGAAAASGVSSESIIKAKDDNANPSRIAARTQTGLPSKLKARATVMISNDRSESSPLRTGTATQAVCSAHDDADDDYSESDGSNHDESASDESGASSLGTAAVLCGLEHRSAGPGRAKETTLHPAPIPVASAPTRSQAAAAVPAVTTALVDHDSDGATVPAAPPQAQSHSHVSTVSPQRPSPAVETTPRVKRFKRVTFAPSVPVSLSLSGSIPGSGSLPPTPIVPQAKRQGTRVTRAGKSSPPNHQTLPAFPVATVGHASRAAATFIPQAQAPSPSVDSVLGEPRDSSQSADIASLWATDLNQTTTITAHPASASSQDRRMFKLSSVAPPDTDAGLPHFDAFHANVQAREALLSSPVGGRGCVCSCQWKLVRADGTVVVAVLIPRGELVLGRGTLTLITSKSVSREHVYIALSKEGTVSFRQVKKQACYLRRQGAPTFQAIPSGELREGDTLALSSAFGDTGFQLVREAGAQPGNCPVHRSVEDRAGVPGQLEPVPQLQESPDSPKGLSGADSVLDKLFSP